MVAQSSEAPSSPAVAQNSTPATGRRGRGPKKITRLGPQPTKLQAVDDTLGPLGPLGATAPPAAEEVAPQENVAPQAGRSIASSQQSSLHGLLESTHLQDNEDEDGPIRPRQPPPVQRPSGEQPQRQMQPSVSVVEAAKPTFNITVGDPHKVGDLTSAHTEYQVYTKVY
jgi:sorting nexin-1/2